MSRYEWIVVHSICPGLLTAIQDLRTTLSEALVQITSKMGASHGHVYNVDLLTCSLRLIWRREE